MGGAAFAIPIKHVDNDDGYRKNRSTHPTIICGADDMLNEYTERRDDEYTERRIGN